MLNKNPLSQEFDVAEAKRFYSDLRSQAAANEMTLDIAEDADTRVINIVIAANIPGVDGNIDRVALVCDCDVEFVRIVKAKLDEQGLWRDDGLYRDHRRLYIPSPGNDLELSRFTFNVGLLVAAGSGFISTNDNGYSFFNNIDEVAFVPQMPAGPEPVVLEENKRLTVPLSMEELLAELEDAARTEIGHEWTIKIPKDGDLSEDLASSDMNPMTFVPMLEHVRLDTRGIAGDVFVDTNRQGDWFICVGLSHEERARRIS